MDKLVLQSKMMVLIRNELIGNYISFRSRYDLFTYSNNYYIKAEVLYINVLVAAPVLIHYWKKLFPLSTSSIAPLEV